MQKWSIRFAFLILCLCALGFVILQPVQGMDFLAFSQSKFSNGYATEHFSYEETTDRIVLQIVADRTQPSDSWSLQRYWNGAWQKICCFDSFERVDQTHFAFSLSALSPLPAGEYRFYDDQTGKSSNSFCVGSLDDFWISALQPSQYASWETDSEIMLEIKALTSDILCYTFTNHSASDLEFGCGAWIEIKKFGNWYRVPEHIAFEAVVQSLHPGSSTAYTEAISLKSYDLTLCSGTYRVVKNYSMGNSNYYAYAEFEISTDTLAETPVLEDSLSLHSGRTETIISLRNIISEPILIFSPETFQLQSSAQSAPISEEDALPTHFHTWETLDTDTDSSEIHLNLQRTKNYRLWCLCYSAAQGLFWSVISYSFINE